MSETVGENYPSQEAMEAAYTQMGLDNAPESVLEDDEVAYQQCQLARRIEAQGGNT
jgi:hypothetical protein